MPLLLLLYPMQAWEELQGKEKPVCGTNRLMNQFKISQGVLPHLTFALAERHLKRICQNHDGVGLSFYLLSPPPLDYLSLHIKHIISAICRPGVFLVLFGELVVGKCLIEVGMPSPVLQSLNSCTDCAFALLMLLLKLTVKSKYGIFLVSLRHHSPCRVAFLQTHAILRQHLVIAVLYQLKFDYLVKHSASAIRILSPLHGKTCPIQSRSGFSLCPSSASQSNCKVPPDLYNIHNLYYGADNIEDMKHYYDLEAHWDWRLLVCWSVLKCVRLPLFLG